MPLFSFFFYRSVSDIRHTVTGFQRIHYTFGVEDCEFFFPVPRPALYSTVCRQYSCKPTLGQSVRETPSGTAFQCFCCVYEEMS